MSAGRDRLPERLAVHWGWNGEPDRWQSFIGASATAAVITTLLPLLVVGFGAAVHRSGRGPLAGVAAAMAVLIGGASFGLLLAQREGQLATPLPIQWMVLTAALALVLGTAVWRWGRVVHSPVGSGRPPMPADAAHLDVTPTTRIAWTGKAALPAWGVPVTVTVAVAVLVVVASVGEPWLLLLALGLAAPLAVTYSARVVVDSTGLRVAGLGFTCGTVPLGRVASAEVGRVSPRREFGGWGWRIALDGRRGYVTREGEALIVHRIGEPDLVVTMDRAEEAAAALNTLASRVG
jgi:hypothetical protein